MQAIIYSRYGGPEVLSLAEAAAAFSIWRSVNPETGTVIQSLRQG